MDPGSIPSAVKLDGSFIQGTSAIHLITMVPACLVGVTWSKVTFNSLSHPSTQVKTFMVRHTTTSYGKRQKIFILKIESTEIDLTTHEYLQQLK